MAGLFTPHIANRAAPSAPNATDPAIAAARDATVSAAANVFGRIATNPTGGQGDASTAKVAKKTLLGGG